MANTSKKELIENFSTAIKEAQIAANAVNTGEDGGTCNFDNPVIDFTGWTKKDIEILVSEAGIKIGDKMSGYWRNCRKIYFDLKGQGNNRARMSTAAYKKLKEFGIPALHYQQMD